MNRMEIFLQRVKRIANYIFLFFCFSCGAQSDIERKEDLVYSVIDKHYNLRDLEPNAKFLYHKTISPKEESPLAWVNEIRLAEFLMDSVFTKNCRIIETIFLPAEIEDINSQFSNLESQVLKDEKLSASVLNTKFLNQETYVNAPAEANRKISYPIIIKTDQSIYSLFVEDAHNEGGRLFIYELQGVEWKVICMDSLWLI